jgi:hypothetical protein
MSAFSFQKNSHEKYNNICALFREAVLTKSTVNNLSDGERNNFFFDSSLLKVSVDQFSLNRYIAIRNPQVGDEDISSDEDEADCSFNLVSEGNVREI